MIFLFVLRPFFRHSATLRYKPHPLDFIHKLINRSSTQIVDRDLDALRA